MNIQAYLDRIDYQGPREPTAETLRALHRAHMLAVPFENLDIHLGRPIALDAAALYDKIVRRRRGGFCYELNGLFAALLRELGFDVTMLSARVAREAGGFGPEFDHLTLLVEGSGIGDRGPGTAEQTILTPAPRPLTPTRWLADVGFGDSFREPLRLDELGEQIQDGGAYRIDRDGPQLTMLERGDDGAWQPQYRFTLQPRTHPDFTEMCQYHQTSPGSSFTRKRICSRATPEGRVSLSDLLLIITERRERRERALAGEAEHAAALKEYFDVDLSLD